MSTVKIPRAEPQEGADACTQSLREEQAWSRLIAMRARRGRLPIDPGGAALEPDLAQFGSLYLSLCALPRNRLAVVAHLGQSLDGRIATVNGDSRFVTGPGNILHLHRMRALADAVMVGANTVVADDPQLTVRRCTGDHPLRVVIDPECRLHPDFRLFADGAAPTLVLAAADRAAALPVPRLGLAEVVGVPRGPLGLDIAAIRDLLYRRGVRLLFVEGGGVTVSRLLTARAIDRLQVTIAPLIIGSGRHGLMLPAIDRLSHALRPATRRYQFGDDVMVECRFDGD